MKWIKGILMCSAAVANTQIQHKSSGKLAVIWMPLMDCNLMFDHQLLHTHTLTITDHRTNAIRWQIGAHMHTGIRWLRTYIILFFWKFIVIWNAVEKEVNKFNANNSKSSVSKIQNTNKNRMQKKNERKMNKTMTSSNI